MSRIIYSGITHPRAQQRAFTLVEIMIASTLAVMILAGMLSFILMIKNGVTSGQSQVWLHNDARYGTQRITRLIQEARIVASRGSGTEIYIINPNDTASLVYFEDADDDPDTVADNVIWYDPDTEVGNNEEAMVRYVTPIDEEPLFANVRGGVSLTYHVGDPQDGDDTIAGRKSGRGYQGLQIRVVAKPRNIGHIWTSEGF